MSSLSELSPSQRSNAVGIIAAVKERKMGINAAIIAVMTTLVESGMRMIASANVPESIKYPHERLSWTSDGLGHDHASCGMYQQQTGYRWALPGTSTMGTPDGWGTPATLMNAEKSTGLFLDRLVNQNWQTGTPWVVAQNVQGSAYDGNPRASNNYNRVYGGNYQSQYARAKSIVRSLWGDVMTRSDVLALLKPLQKQLDATQKELSAVHSHHYQRLNHLDREVAVLNQKAGIK